MKPVTFDICFFVLEKCLYMRLSFEQSICSVSSVGWLTLVG